MADRYTYTTADYQVRRIRYALGYGMSPQRVLAHLHELTGCDELNASTATTFRYLGREFFSRGLEIILTPEQRKDRRFIYLCGVTMGRNGCYRQGVLTGWFEMFGKEGAD